MKKLFGTVLFIMLISLGAQASLPAVSYQGRILKPDGSPLAGHAVSFRFQIRTPDANSCLMFEESQTLDLHTTNGSFALSINDGSGTRTDTTSLSLERIFANLGTFTFDPTTCANGSSYSPSASDGRILAVLFKDETMSTWEPIPPQKISFVPFALESRQVQGFTADSLLRVVNGSVDPITGLAPLSNAQYNALFALSGGSTTTVSVDTSGTVNSAVTTTRDFKILAASPSTFSIDMQAPALTASYSLVWPPTGGTNGDVLTTDGSGHLSWSAQGSGSQWTTHGTNISFDGTGNVGIGTTSPQRILDVSAASTDTSPVGSTGLANLAITNTDSTTNNTSDLSFIGFDLGGTPAMNAKISAQYTSHATGVQSADLLFITRNAGGKGERLRIASNGNVGIGTTSPTKKLQVAGEIAPSVSNTYSLGDGALLFTAVYATNGTIQTSDVRAKKEIENSDLGLDFIRQLRPVSYRWKSGPDSDLHYGLIAQETETAVNKARLSSGHPSASGDQTIISHDAKTDRYGLKYTELISPLIKALQDLYARTDRRQSEIEKDLARKSERLDQLEKLNALQTQELRALKGYVCAKDRESEHCR